MERNTKIKLNKEISISSACYSDTDHLLCHDDNNGDRRIAFVLYLSENWEAADGGALELFDTDENGLPKNVVYSLVPEYNSLVFFEVTENSFHQVAEVISSEKCRWSINGWFHGPLIEKERPLRPDSETALIEPEKMQVCLEQWISNSYLSPQIIRTVKLNIEFESYAFLTEFIRPDVYEKLSQDITNEKILWKRVGPADIRNYEIAEEETLPEKLKEFCKLFKSIVIFDLLKRYTELDLVPEKEGMNPTMSLELQRWSVGCYTLISDCQVDDATSSTTDRKSTSNLEAMEEEHLSDDVNAGQELKPCCFPGSGTGDNCLPGTVDTPPTSGGDTEDENTKRELKEKSPMLTKKYVKRSRATSSNVKVSDCKYEMKQGSDSEESEVEKIRGDEIRLSLHQATSSNIEFSPSNFEMNRGTDSEESDIEDYLSDSNDDTDDKIEDEIEQEIQHVMEDAPETARSIVDGSLDLIIQFHTNNIPEGASIDYVSPKDQSTLINVPTKDNHLSLVYKRTESCRLHKYVNHYCKGYFYNLICTYYE